MTLSPGTRLGPYELVAPVGAGGMGEVYRARDTRLERTVAIKVLPSHLSENAEVRQRFEREAKTISSLSHPHICSLYDVGHQDGTDYLVMEYLEGETLADRLAKGPLPLEQTLRYGVEIADALGKAHRQGIVHRDLKPGNVMLTKSGVKLLDFGLAKTFGRSLDATGNEQAAAGQHPMAGNALTAIPTVIGSPNLTQEGTILGTFQYMAPEQLEGKEADARTDIFALGAVLYEMATGQKAFSGRSQASLISSIMGAEPPAISTIAPMTPPALDRIVKTCLAKDPEDRWQTAHDIAVQLRWIAEGGSAVGLPAPLVARGRSREPLGWIVASFTTLAALALAFVHFREVPPEARRIRFFVYPPEGTGFAPGPAAPQAALSPDGRQLTFAAMDKSGKRLLWIRPLDSLTAQALSGTEGASLPFWSPDGRWIAFFADRKLKKIEVSGGLPQTVCDAPAGNGGTWNRDGVIVFASDFLRPLFRVSATGDTPAATTALEKSRQETAHLWPQFLPNGRDFLYLAHSRRQEHSGIYAGSLDSKQTRRVLGTEVRAAYAPPGYLLFVREAMLMAQRFDPDRFRLEGEPFRIAEEVAYNPSMGRTAFSVSDSGALAYRAGGIGGLPDTELTWFDRKGKKLGSASAAGMHRTLALSPDETRVAVARTDPQTGKQDIWLIALAGSTAARFTFGPTSEAWPLWSSDGARIVFAANRSGTYDVYQKNSSGAGSEETLIQSEANKSPTHYSWDGRFIIYEIQDGKTGADLWVLPLFGDRKPIPFLQSEFNERQGQLSPDGRWMAYSSDESGKDEVYVQAFPVSGSKWLISSAGGAHPRWRRDGKELFYIAADQKMMSVAVRADPTFQAGSPQELFEANIFPVPTVIPYVASADGQRFLVNTVVPEETPSPITVVLNWAAGLKP